MTTNSPSDPTVTLLWRAGGARIAKTFLASDPSWRRIFQVLARSEHAAVAIHYSRYTST